MPVSVTPPTARSNRRRRRAAENSGRIMVRTTRDSHDTPGVSAASIRQVRPQKLRYAILGHHAGINRQDEGSPMVFCRARPAADDFWCTARAGLAARQASRLRKTVVRDKMSRCWSCFNLLFEAGSQPVPGWADLSPRLAAGSRDRRRPAYADRRTHRVREDAGRVLVCHRPESTRRTRQVQSARPGPRWCTCRRMKALAVDIWRQNLERPLAEIADTAAPDGPAGPPISGSRCGPGTRRRRARRDA